MRVGGYIYMYVPVLRSKGLHPEWSTFPSTLSGVMETIL